jgi:hypothetical protein
MAIQYKISPGLHLKGVQTLPEGCSSDGQDPSLIQTFTVPDFGGLYEMVRRFINLSKDPNGEIGLGELWCHGPDHIAHFGFDDLEVGVEIDLGDGPSGLAPNFEVEVENLSDRKCKSIYRAAKQILNPSGAYLGTRGVKLSSVEEVSAKAREVVLAAWAISRHYCPVDVMVSMSHCHWLLFQFTEKHYRRLTSYGLLTD